MLWCVASCSPAWRRIFGVVNFVATAFVAAVAASASASVSATSMLQSLHLLLRIAPPMLQHEKRSSYAGALGQATLSLPKSYSR